MRARHVPLRYKRKLSLSPWMVERLFRQPWKRQGCPFKSWALRKRYRYCLAKLGERNG